MTISQLDIVVLFLLNMFVILYYVGIAIDKSNVTTGVKILTAVIALLNTFVICMKVAPAIFNIPH